MGRPGVIDLDGFLDHDAGLREVGGAPQTKLILHDSIDPLSQCILVTVIAIGNRAGNPMLLVYCLISSGAILDPLIQVMDQRQRALSSMQGPETLEQLLLRAG
jgi:hypothetical protein